MPHDTCQPIALAHGLRIDITRDLHQSGWQNSSRLTQKSLFVIARPDTADVAQTKRGNTLRYCALRV